MVYLTESDVADFDGRSSLLYRFNQKSMSTVKDVVSLRFKSRQAEGVLLHGRARGETTSPWSSTAAGWRSTSTWTRGVRAGEGGERAPWEG